MRRLARVVRGGYPNFSCMAGGITSALNASICHCREPHQIESVPQEDVPRAERLQQLPEQVRGLVRALEEGDGERASDLGVEVPPPLDALDHLDELRDAASDEVAGMIDGKVQVGPVTNHLREVAGVDVRLRHGEEAGQPLVEVDEPDAAL